MKRPIWFLVFLLALCAVYFGWALRAWAEPAATLPPGPSCAALHVYPSPGPGDSVFYTWTPSGGSRIR